MRRFGVLVGALALGSSGYLAACTEAERPRDAPKAVTTDETPSAKVILETTTCRSGKNFSECEVTQVVESD